MSAPGRRPGPAEAPPPPRRGPSPGRSGPRRRRGATARRAGRLVWQTLTQAWSDRVMGLAAEAAFWTLLSMGPMLLIVVGVVGYLTPLFGPHVLDHAQARILTASADLLAPSAVDGILRPLLSNTLRHGHFGIISIGFPLALWAGSAAMNTYVNTITIAYGQRHARTAVHSRILAFLLYLGGLIVGSIILPLLVTTPAWILSAIPDQAKSWLTPLVRYGYWPVLIVICTTLLATLYHLAVPVRARWRRDVPGAVVAMLLWLGGSALLRLVLTASIGSSPAYGVLAAPVAILLFLYVTALAVLLGAELNAAVGGLHPPKQATG